MKEEKEKLFNILETKIESTDRIDDLIKQLPEKELAKKIKNATKEIVKRKQKAK